MPLYLHERQQHNTANRQVVLIDAEEITITHVIHLKISLNLTLPLVPNYTVRSNPPPFFENYNIEMAVSYYRRFHDWANPIRYPFHISGDALTWT
ncbi:hypothetical protein DSUL_20291 [Desulfovibrionales bacterium]